jgi:hypothetical protein
MKYIVEEPKRRRFTEDRVSKHHKILRELPADIDTRIANIHRRNEILKANKHYQLKIERDRAYAALQSMPSNAQANLRQLIVKHYDGLYEAMQALGKKGATP